LEAFQLSMRAQLLEKQGSVENRLLRNVELPKPKPDDAEVLIRVSSCGVCRTDLHIVEGDLPLRKKPIVPGHQIVGTVEAVGSSVNEIEIGRRVGVAWLGSTCGQCRFV
jgi:propanol-preferring alcohol dehydrogenase